MRPLLSLLVLLAGAGQLVLVVASTAIPRALGWREELRVLRPLTRQVFWNYAGYILATNLWFGLVSLVIPGALVDRSPLATAVTAFITLYWGARVAVQLFYFDRSAAPSGRLFVLAEAALLTLFAGLTGVYGAALAHNLGVLP
jgi:hypothetical protein